MEWVFPCRLEDFNVHEAFRHQLRLNWECYNKVDPGDIVYIYTDAPESAIRYKCQVLDIDIPYSTIDDSEYGGSPAGTPSNWVEIELLESYPSPGITLQELREHGINPRYSMQGKFMLPPETLEFIEQRATELIESEGPDVVEAKDLDEFSGEEREAIIKVRVNQSRYRKDLLKKYDRCALCGVANKGVLIASHIKPWSKSEPQEKTDIDNGLILCPNHDSLLDKGLISFDRNGNIVISNVLSPGDRTFMNVNENMHIELTGRMVSYMAYHLKYLFKSGKLQ